MTIHLHVEISNGVCFSTENYQHKADALRNVFRNDIRFIQETAHVLFNNPKWGREIWACDPNEFRADSKTV